MHHQDLIATNPAELTCEQGRRPAGSLPVLPLFDVQGVCSILDSLARAGGENGRCGA
jgi:hypothetical protein